MITTVIEPKEIEKLTPMPASLSRLAAVVGQPDSSVADVSAVVELDQALTANVLRLANSTWSASHTPIDTVRGAVIRLGAGRILEIAVGQRVAGPMNSACPGYELGEHELWRHSVASALAAEQLNRFATQQVPSVAFTAALLHDIGKLVLGRHLNPELIQQVRDLARHEKLCYLDAERRIIGVDHAEVGGAIARHWQFPAQIVNAIEHHHDPDAQPEPVLDAVHIANAVAKLIGIGLGSEQMNMKASAQAAARLGLSSSHLEALCATVVDELARTEELWGVNTHGS